MNDPAVSASAVEPEERPCRILIVDDHTLFAEGAALLLRALGPGVRVVHATSCEQALSLLEGDTGFSLILFDLALPGLSHLAAFEQLRARALGAPVVAISADERPRMVAEVLRAGARGYIPKSTCAEVTLGALRLVLAGGTYVPPSLVLEGLAAPLDHKLTTRELEVLELLAQGRRNKEIAGALGVAESTVRVHVASIQRRLDLGSRQEASSSPLVAALLANRRAGPPPRA